MEERKLLLLSLALVVIVKLGEAALSCPNGYKMDVHPGQHVPNGVFKEHIRDKDGCIQACIDDPECLGVDFKYELNYNQIMITLVIRLALKMLC